MNNIKIFIWLFIFTVISLPQNKWVVVGTLPSSIPPIYCISAPDSRVIFLCSTGGNIYRSIDGGVSWELKNQYLSSADFYTIFALDSLNCWVGTSKGVIYRTTNGGNMWVESFPIIGTFVDEIKMFDYNNGLCIADPSVTGQPFQIRYTKDGGTTWIQSSNAPLANNEFPVENVWDIIDTSFIWFGTLNNIFGAANLRVYRTTSGITGNWSYSFVNSNFAQGLSFVNPNDGMICTSGNVISKTTDGGATWAIANNPPGVRFHSNCITGAKDGSNIIRIAIEDSELVICRIFRTTDLGDSWVEETLPTATSISYMQTLNSNLCFAGSYEGKFLKYENVVSVEASNFPVSDYRLFQNFPNPFNPTTMIKYSLQSECNVVINIFNSLGQIVKVLASGIQPPGTHEINFDASSVSSGVYFYDLEAISIDGGQNFRSTKKMVVVK